MNANTLKNMQYFVGKVCSIVATAMNRSFDETLSRRHFVVRVQEVTTDGIWGTNPYDKDMVSFFAMPHIISVHQEVELDPTNPEHAALIAEYEKRTGKKIKSDLGAPIQKMEPKKDLPVIEKTPAMEAEEASTTGDATFIDIESLERLAEQTKRTFEAYSILGKQ